MQLRREHATLEDEMRLRAEKLTPSHPDVLKLQAELRRVEQHTAETNNQIDAARAHPPEVDRSNTPLIDNSFTMEVGETVVVGTSRLGGDKALIAIVTAVRKGAR